MILTGTDKNGQYGVQWRKEPKGQEFNYNTHTAGLAALASLLRSSPP
jgi:hypothetical protein